MAEAITDRAAAARLSDEVEMQIRGLMMDPVTNMPIVVLKDVAGDTVLPIWVGIFEANAIALELEKTATPRPMTHDLLQNMARGLNARVQKVVVSELREDTFYAVIWMDHSGEMVLNVTLTLEVTRFPARRIERDQSAVAGPMPNPAMLSAGAN